jgi:hypothetical protein
MALQRRRVTLTLPPELHDRAKAVLADIPGATLSALVEDALEGMLPALENLAAAYRDGGEDAARRALAHTLGEELLGLREDIRTPPGKGVTQGKAK